MLFTKFISLVSFILPVRSVPKHQILTGHVSHSGLVAEWMKIPRFLSIAAILCVALTPAIGRACACGCTVFEVGDLSMFPEVKGAMFSLEFDYQNQNLNWSGSSRGSAENNPDKKIQTSFVTADFQYVFNRSWGIQIAVPYAYRSFTTTGGATGNDTVSNNWGSLGDIRIQGIYTGFFEDQSAGVTFGVKLPTGNLNHNDAFNDIDRDTQIGTGSTDILLGGFYHHKLTSDDHWRWFAQAEMDLPALTQDQYRPGFEIDASTGIYYNGWTFHGVRIRPVGQVIVSERTHDSGAHAADPVASGYQRVLLSPGIEIDMHRMKVNGQVDFPVYQHVTGNQLVAPALFKLTVSYMF